jgi:CDP-glucose 4,6-dehydratase
MFNQIYKNKRVLITGNTGFKGSWLTLWLLRLGAKVYGISNGIPSEPSLFEVLSLEKEIDYYEVDINNYTRVAEAIQSIKPEIVFHLAAQPVIAVGFEEPLTTFSTNIMGTIHILEALRVLNEPCAVICVTSFKCYKPIKHGLAYTETDKLGGPDPYSASKAANELAIEAYFQSYFNKPDCKVKVISARGGNVIGGGDWAKTRIVPDAFRCWEKKSSLLLFAPTATPPWQYVLDILNGYLICGQSLLENKPDVNGEAFNIGAPENEAFTVQALLDSLFDQTEYKGFEPYQLPSAITDQNKFSTSLNSDNALNKLNWKSYFNFNNTVKRTGNWYKNFYDGSVNMRAYTEQEIADFEKLLKE